MSETHNPRAASEADEKLGARIRDCRRALGISQEELAEVIGVTFQQVQKYENGRNRITATRLVAIARHLKVNVSSLLGEQEAKGEAALELITGQRVKAVLQDVNRALAALILARQALLALQVDFPPPADSEAATLPKEFLDRRCVPEEG